MRRLVTALIILSALPGSALAATLGDVSTASTNTYPASAGVYIQTVGGNMKSYVASADGVITSVSTIATGSSISARVFVARPVPMSTTDFTVIGGGNVPLTASTSPAPTAPARIPVKKDDVLGVFYPNGSSYGTYSASGAVIPAAGAPGPPADGSTISATSGVGNVNLLIAAKLEPDADGDGYGDETQDSCPTLAAVHSGSCATDLRIAASASPATVEQGQLTSVVATITNAGSVTAYATTAALTIPDSLEVVAASSAAGDCSATSCALGDIPPAASRKVYLVLKPKATGSPTVGFSTAAATFESAPGDNTTSVPLTVTAPPTASPSPSPSPTATPTPAPAAVKLCAVPKLKGKTKAKAKAALTAAGCKAGTVHGKKGKVSTQTIPAYVKVLAGTKVGFTLKRSTAAGCDSRSTSSPRGRAWDGWRRRSQAMA